MKKTMSVIMSVLLALTIIVPGTTVAFAEGEYDTEGAYILEFSDDEIKTTQKGDGKVEIDGTALSIKKEGTYIVSGSCKDGSIVVKKATTGVILVLNGLTLESETTAPITCNKSSAATIIAASTTVNTLTDNAINNDDEYPDNENAENAVLKCKDGSNVVLDGAGTLNINSNGKNGIKSGCTTEDEGEASFTIRNLTLNITAKVNDGINAEQLLTIESGNITVDAADDGIHCDLVMNIGTAGNNTTPVIKVTNSYEGIEAASLNVLGGDINIHATDDGMNAANSDLTDYDFELNIKGGKIYVDAENGDGIDSNGTLTISGGNVIVFSSAMGDNAPLDSDGKLSITGGTVFAVGSSRMAQTPQNSQNFVEFGSTGSGMMGGMDKPGSQPGGKQGNNTVKKPEGQGGMNPFGGGSLFGESSSLSIKAGDTITIKNSDGETLVEAVAPRDAGYVLYSAEGVTEDNIALYINGTATNASTNSSSGISGFFSNIVSKIKSFFERIIEFFKNLLSK